MLARKDARNGYSLFAALGPQMRRNNKYFKTTRHIQHIALEVVSSVYRSISEYPCTDQVTCNVFLYHSHLHTNSRPHPPHPPFRGRFPSVNPQPPVTCPRPPLQPPQPQTIKRSSTMPSKLTRKRPRKISAPTHYSTNSRTVTLQMPSSTHFTNKFPGSTKLVVPMTK